MTNRRPTPELIAARKWEIRQRYERQAKIGKRSRHMAAIRLAELSRWLEDSHGAGCELEPTSSSEAIARIFVNHFVIIADGNRRAAQWLEMYCPWISVRSREAMITAANNFPIFLSADKLGWKVKLTDEQRTRLKITTIGAVGITKEQRAERRKAASRARSKAYRERKKAERTI